MASVMSVALFKSSENVEIFPMDKNTREASYTLLIHLQTRSSLGSVSLHCNAMSLYLLMNNIKLSPDLCLSRTRSMMCMIFSSSKNLLQNSVAIYSQVWIELGFNLAYQVKAFLISDLENSLSLKSLSPQKNPKRR